MVSISEILGQPNAERSDEEREAEAVGTAEDIRYCACGCGQKLAPTNQGTFMVGHRLSTSRVPRDPDRAPSSGKKPQTFPGDKLTEAEKKDLAEKLEFLMGMLGLAWAKNDPYCGGTFLDQTEVISEKLVPLIARNKMLREFFISEGRFGMALELAIALAPVGKAVAQHHIFHTVEIEEEAPSNPSLYPVE